MLSWVASEPSQAKASDRSFVKLNKMAAKVGLTNSRELREFRAENDARVSKSKVDRSIPKRSTSVVYGKVVRPSTPVGHLIKGHPNLPETDYPDLSQMRLKGKMPYPAMTRASEGHRVRPAPEAREPFKLGKFKAVPSRLQPGASASYSAAGSPPLSPLSAGPESPQ